MDGIVFSIEEFSIYDGPGIRTTVFLKGCPLRCSWCHNPEGQRREPETVKSPNGCIHCGNCQKGATWQDGRRVLSPESIKNCPMHLIRMAGEAYTPERLCEKLLKNKTFLKDGGVTFSGGEPLFQHEFVLECLTLLKGELHRAIQTSGYVSPPIFQRVMESADYFLYDLKLIDEEAHRSYTGVSNRMILENFRTLAQSGVDFVVRVPLIPGVTDTLENIAAIARTLADCGVHDAELLTYNKMAGGKYEMVGRKYQPDFDATVESQPRLDVFEQFGVNAKIIK